MKSYLIGIFKNTTQFETKEGIVNLTSAKLNSSQNPVDFPFIGGREREGHIAIVSGFFQNNSLFECNLVEVSPSWISEILVQMLKKGDITWDVLITQLNFSKEILIGPVPIPIVASSSKPLCVLVVGHRESQQGARTVTENVSEFDFNSEIAEKVQEKVTKAEVKILFRDDDSQGYRKLPAKINREQPDFIVSLHFNAASSSRATGTEMLYYHSSSKGHNMALKMQRHVLSALNLSNRKTKKIKATERGGHLLKYTAAPCIITEPFFGSNKNDEKKVLDNVQKLVDAYVLGIDEIATSMF